MAQHSFGLTFCWSAYLFRQPGWAEMCPNPATRINVPNSEIGKQQKLFGPQPRGCTLTWEALIHKAFGAKCAFCDDLLECAICDKREGSLNPPLLP